MTRIPTNPAHHGTPRTSKLTPEQEQEIAEFRAALCLEVGVCEICRKVEWPAVCGHEIIRSGLRKFVYGNRSLVLVVCEPCHKRIDHEPIRIPQQLAYLYRSRPLDLRLDQVNRWSIKRITRRDVMAIVKEIEAVVED